MTEVSENQDEHGSVLALKSTGNVPDRQQMVSNARPEVVIIQGTTTIDKSPFNYLAQEELEFILRFISSKDHMKYY